MEAVQGPLNLAVRVSPEALPARISTGGGIHASWAVVFMVEMTMLRCCAALVVAAMTTACFSTVQVPAASGPSLSAQPGRFPHDVLDAVLAKHVDEQGRVDYATLAADRNDLVRYLQVVASVSPHSDPALFPTDADQLAYWINAYNAYVLFAVTERPTMKSVDDDKADFFYFTKYVFGGEAISLYDLENEVVRKEHAEPRIHFALNCASAGCPQLPAEAFVPDRLEAQLAREARAFCADPGKVRVDDEAVRVSQIFEWYAEDFAAGPVAFCRRWGRDDLPAQAPVEYIPYDWTLNAQPGRR